VPEPSFIAPLVPHGRLRLNGLRTVGALLAFGDLPRLSFSGDFALPRNLLDVILFGGLPILCAVLCGYWAVLGSRYLAARAMVATEETLSGATQR